MAGEIAIVVICLAVIGNLIVCAYSATNHIVLLYHRVKTYGNKL